MALQPLPNVLEGFQIAKESLLSGKGLKALNKLQEL
jgi:hypothetical protein